MRPVTYSWIGLSAASPLIFLVCAWALGVFHSYRRYWRSVDLFLLAIFVQELLMAFQVFVFSLLSLVQPSAGVICGIMIWSLSATRTLQAATVTSLLVDRALTSQWPYRYRFSVRRHQIRYHLVVLATMAALVGVAAILARPSEPGLSTKGFDECAFLPHNLHIRLALFLLSLSGVLVVISAVSVCVVQTSRGCKGGFLHQTESQDMTPITHGTTGSSTNTDSTGRTPIGGKPLTPAASSASTTSSASSGRLGIQSASSTTDLVAPTLRPFHKRGANNPQKMGGHRGPSVDFRWGSSLVIAFLCYFTNHFPYMGLLIMGTFFPSFLPAWPMENLSLWLSLFEGLLLPLALGIFDRTFGEAAILSCSRDKRPPSPGYEEPSAPFRFIPKDEIKAFPLTNGSLFSSLLNMHMEGPTLHGLPPYNRAKAHLNILRMGTGIQDIRNAGGFCPSTVALDPRVGPNFGQLFYNPGGPTSLPVDTTCQGSFYSDPLSKAISTDSSLKTSDDDHIYASLSETFGSVSSISDDYLGENPRCSSATTVANDDFEYHGPQVDSHPGSIDSAGFVIPCNVGMTSISGSGSNAKGERYSITPCTNSSEEGSPSSSFRSFSSLPSEGPSLTLNILQNPSYKRERMLIIPSSSPRLGFVNKAFISDSFSDLHGLDQKDPVGRSDGTAGKADITSGRSRIPSIPEEGTLSRKHRSSSLSMNDLDRIEPESEEEMMFILPVKSESMLSLYRLYLAEDEESGTTSLHYSLEISKSENDLTAVHQNNSNVTGDLKPVNNQVQEIYRKKRGPLSAASRIRRQHKIQRAKGLHSKTRPVIKQRTQTYRLDPDENPISGEKTPQKIRVQNPILEEKTPKKIGVQLAVLNKAKRKNGIITITDPSVLSVEELFKVLNRASISGTGFGTDATDKGLAHSHQGSSGTSYPVTEYKKIFVSEYIYIMYKCLINCTKNYL